MKRSNLTVAAIAVALLNVVTAVDADTLKVCQSQPACKYSNAQLQNAIDAARPGDEILLQSGMIYATGGGYVLRGSACAARDDTCYITLRTGVDRSGNLLASGTFPGTDIRVTSPAQMAILKVNGNNEAAIRTVFPGETGPGCAAAPCTATYWKLQHVAVTANGYGGGSLISLGLTWLGSGQDEQSLKSEIPSNLVLDQVYVYGDPVTGQHRCLTIAARRVTVKNSYFKDCKSNRHDGQAIAVGNTDGPITILNNYLEGSTENMIVGGQQPEVRQTTAVSGRPTPTRTQFALESVTDLEVGQWIGVTLGGSMRASKVTDLTGNTVTIRDPLPSAPEAGAVVKYGIVAKDLTVQKNHFKKPMAWRDPVVATTGGVRATPASGGRLTAGTYYYRVIARHLVNEANMFRSTPSAEVSCTVDGAATSACQVSWDAVANVTSPYSGEYYIYGRAKGAQRMRFSVSAPTTTFTDTGGAGAAEDVPTGSGNTWSIKNIFELKGCVNCLVEGNLFENTWQSGQDGYAILFTTLTEGGNEDISTVVRDVTFRHNIIRNANGALLVSSADATNNSSGVMENMTVSNNLWYGIGRGFGTSRSARTILFTFGDNNAAASHLDLAPANFTFDHNTVMASDNSQMVLFIFCNSKVQNRADDFKFKNNIIRRQDGGMHNYGCDGPGGIQAEGDDGWNGATEGPGREFTKNALQGANRAIYRACTGCEFPNESTFEAQFVDYAANNYRLAVGSKWKHAGTDGADLGADIDAIEAWTKIAESGDNSGRAAGNSPTPAPSNRGKM